MAEIGKYRLWCDTDSKYVEGWSQRAPTVCYENNTHDIDTESITKVDSVSQTRVVIQEELIPTNGKYKFRGFCIEVAPSVNTVHTFEIDAGIATTVLSTEFVTSANMEGDIVDVFTAPDTPVAIISADISAGDTIININPVQLNDINPAFPDSIPAFFDQVIPGYKVILNYNPASEGDTVDIDFNALYKVIATDDVNHTCTLDRPISASFSAAVPCYVKLYVHAIENFIIGPAFKTIIGETKIGGTYVPANVKNKIIYKNSTDEAKSFKFQIDYMH